MRLGWLAYVCVILVVPAWGACKESHPYRPPPDASVDIPPPRILQLESPRLVLLGLHESAVVQARYLELDETPIEGGVLGFAFYGNAHDSSLSSLEELTSVEGRAQVTLTAGASPAAFRVRITAARAQALFVDVSVSDRGFGDFVVTAHDLTGDRPVDRFVVHLYAEASCDDEALEEGEPAREVVLDNDLQAELPSLPAELSYAVVVRAEGEGGGVLGWGCADAVVVADEQVPVEVTVVAVALEVTGTYDAKVELGSGPAATRAGDWLELAGVDYVTWSGGEAEMLLFAVHAYLEADEETQDLAEMFALYWASQIGLLEEDLDAELAADGVGAIGATQALANRASDALAAFTVAGTLALTDPQSPTFAWSFSRAEVQAPGTSATVTVSLSGLTPSPAASLSATLLLEADVIEVHSFDVTLGLGGLAMATLDALARHQGATSLAASLRSPIGCNTLANWVEDYPGMNVYCDAACAIAACAAEAQRLVAHLAALMTSLDSQRESIAFGAAATMGILEDTTGDAQVDRIHVFLPAAFWTGTGSASSDAVTGELDVTRTGD
jgi:hypothetical protein